ncbi:MAG: DUF5993 family protein [Phycisphaerales bacterium]|jgi:general stress protein CsbA|nr:DUF5993 family protein [Phycisphaerales bacterium]MDP6310662.1 DUF5993 family protein [Phycisphaerales bacterium]MDP7087505.1 DUF5993 family protein [Phycisphaerales bacterium]MDP7188813.1 DUF5993 family protein [Phycisphaerales bacterium]MDP7520515.1 DUF5993 family protein [Phycisphaerales bacterium]|tara:strand:- start:1007 stop:1165 length:159 start_codon:yes stop_codon:yes gene_type:complete
MIATAIFLMLLVTLLAMRTKRRWPAIICFVITLAAVSLLLWHHITDPLNLSF